MILNRCVLANSLVSNAVALLTITMNMGEKCAEIDRLSTSRFAHSSNKSMPSHIERKTRWKRRALLAVVVGWGCVEILLWSLPSLSLLQPTFASNSSPSSVGLVSVPSSPSSTKPKDIYNSWRHLVKKNLVTCKVFPAICNLKKGMPDRMRAVVVASAKMNQDVWGMGGLKTSLLVLLCYCLGWMIQQLLSRHKTEKQQQHNLPERVDRTFHQSNTILHPAMHFWTEQLTFTRPAATFKLFIASLLFIELNVIMAPQTTPLATPELIRLKQSLPPTLKKKEFVPHLMQWLFPNLNEQTAEEVVGFLETARTMLLLCWIGYLLVPTQRWRLSGTLYAAGAFLYIYLGSIGLMYNLSHCIQGAMLFLLGSVFAVPFLENNRRAAAWLRMYLLVCVFGPIYLFSGVSKIRYIGIEENVTGEWLVQHLEPSPRTVLPHLKEFFLKHSSMHVGMSWGNIVVEIILPILIMVRPAAPIFWRNLFHVGCILFHVAIMLLLGPNFARYCLMHILAMNPLGVLTDTTSQQVSRIPKSMDWFRVGFAVFTLLAWYRVQLLADVTHLLGWLKWNQHRNPYFPFPEMSMFALPSKPNYYASFVLDIASLVAVGLAMMRSCQAKEVGVHFGRRETGKFKDVPVSKLSREDRMKVACRGPTLVFDGICNLCNGSMDWYQNRCRSDSQVWYMWAQHEDTQELLNEIGISRQDILNSWALIENDVVYRGSLAWFRALRHTKAPWRWFAFLDVLPEVICETVYNFVAANRYRLLGHSEVCQRPNPGIKSRLLHSLTVKNVNKTEIRAAPPRRLLVIGCGPAGLFISKAMARRGKGKFEVFVVEPKDYFEFTPGVVRGMCDPREMEALVYRLEPVLCRDLGITFIQGTVTELDSHRATVKPTAGKDTIHVDFDFCVIATGSQYSTSHLWKVPSDPTSDTLRTTAYTLDGRLQEMRSEHEKLKALHEQSGRVFIEGAGLVGVELAAEICHFFPSIEVSMFDPKPRVASTLPSKAQTYAAGWLEAHDVNLVTGRTYNFLHSLELPRDQADLIVYSCVGVKPRAEFLPKRSRDDQGRVRVNAAMQVVTRTEIYDDQTDVEPGLSSSQVATAEDKLFGSGRIFAVGDCVTVEGLPPFTNQTYTAEAMARVVVDNLLKSLTVQCIETSPGILHEIKPLQLEMTLCSLGPGDCMFTVNGFMVSRGKLPCLMKSMIQYTKMSELRNELLGRLVWSLVPHC